MDSGRVMLEEKSETVAVSRFWNLKSRKGAVKTRISPQKCRSMSLWEGNMPVAWK
jgi:hypothetical protein